ncbi:MAG: UDP-3-O-acyl-N-acetylglucosamine deacetylase [Microcoleaceae cyanobacterium]
MQLTTTLEKTGIGLHSGITTTVRIMPTEPNTGRYFVRTDLPDSPIISAKFDQIASHTLSTELGAGDAKVRTVEHLLAALVALGITDARIEIDGPEVPLLDGSAQPWVEAIQDNCQIKTAKFSECLYSEQIITQPIWIYREDAFVAAIPAPDWRFTYGIDFPLPIGGQWYSWNPLTEEFSEAIAPARTFGFAYQVEELRKAGLIKGGSLENALVCDQQKWLNPPLRYANEPVRHKILDLVGDLSLLGTIPRAHYLAYKASHHLHIQLATSIAEKLNLL